MLAPVVLLLLQAALPVQGRQAETDQAEFFESRIRPVLVEHCYACHSSSGQAEGGVRLDHRAAMLEESLFGPVVSPGDPDESVLLQVMRHELEGLEMPEGSAKLSPEVIEDFRGWIESGAYDPRDAPPAADELGALLSWEARLERRMDWWSLQPVASPEPPPEVTSLAHPVDRFVEARRRASGLTAAPQASRRDRLRRLTFALTGLPPSPEDLASFEADPSPDAYSSRVETLLSSPRFGERWARHWMDVMRYADSHGSEGDPRIPFAYRYRDYLIRSFNGDVPYDRFVREHVAGDLIGDPRIDPATRLNESAIATAHWRMVFHGYLPTDPLDEKVRFIDDQINVLGKAFQAQTISCARCHDHKFDAISQADYTALFGVLASCRPGILDVNAPSAQAAGRGALSELKPRLQAALAADWLDALAGDWAVAAMTDLGDTELDQGHPLSALKALGQGVAGDRPWPDAWEQWQVAHPAPSADGEDRRRWDLSQVSGLDQWFPSGNGLAGGPSAAGEFAVSPDGEEALLGVYPAGLYTHGLSTRHRGVLHSARLSLDEDLELWGLVAGEGARFRHVVEDYPRQGTVYATAGVSGGRWEWKRLDLTYWTGDSIHVELVTGRDAPVETTGSDRSWFGVREVALRPRGSAAPLDFRPAAALLRLATETQAPTSHRMLQGAVEEEVRELVRRWRDGEISSRGALVLDACLRHGLLPNQSEALTAAAPLLRRYKELEAEVPTPSRSPGLIEADARDWPLFIRGDHRQPAAPVARRYLEAIDPTPFDAEGSGRLELAAALVHPDNPLTARVMANRVWLHLMGRGLVTTPDNFGRLGATPSHPELLDHLATQLVDGGWSIKSLIRHVVTSETFQLDSAPPREALEVDPENALLSHAHLRRLDAEAIRDAMASVAGVLDDRMYGEGFAPGSTTPRRSVYVRSKRNGMDPFLVAFDAPVPFAPVGARPATIVPAQSLTLLNDPLTWTRARQWAASERRQSATDDERISRMLEQVTGRAADPSERAAVAGYLKACRAEQLAQSERRDALETRAGAARATADQLMARARETLAGSARLEEVKVQAATAASRGGALAAWDFTSAKPGAVGDLELSGTARIEGDGLLLDGGGHAATAPMEDALAARTFTAWVRVDDLDQQGGGLIGVQALDGGQFDSLVLGERRARRWVPGSDNFKRTADLDGPDERAGGDAVHLVLSYAEDGEVTAYRNGVPYGHSIRVGPLARYRAGGWQVLLGLRHGSPSPGRLFRGTVLRAAVHGHAFSREEAVADFEGKAPILREELLAALSGEERARLQAAEATLADCVIVREELGAEPEPDEEWTRVAHALFNLKEFTHVR